MAEATPATGGNVDFGRSFGFVSEDPAWIKKLLIGGAFTLLAVLLVGVPFVLGYFARTLKNTAAGARQPMPEWDDLGGFFSEGLRLTAVYLVYAIGGVVVAMAPGCLLMAPALLASGSRHGESAGAALAGLGAVAFYGLTMLVSLALMVWMPAVLTQVTLVGTVASGFDTRAIVAFVRANVGNYLLSLVIFFVASFASQVAIVLCCVGIFPVAFWAYMVLAVSLGQTVQLSPAAALPVRR